MNLADVTLTFVGELGGDIQADLSKVKEQLDEMVGKSYPIKGLKLDTSQVDAQIKKLKADLASLSGGSTSTGGNILQSANTSGATRAIKQQSAELRTQKTLLDNMAASAKRLHTALSDKPVKDAAKQAKLLSDLQAHITNINHARNTANAGNMITPQRYAHLQQWTEGLNARVAALRAEEQAAEAAAKAEQKLSNAAAKAAQRDIDKQVSRAEKGIEKYEKKYGKLDVGSLGENDVAVQRYLSNLERVKSLTEQTRNLTPTDPNYAQKLSMLKTATDELGDSYDALAQKVKTVSAEQKAFGRQATSVQGQIQKILEKNKNLAGTSYSDSLQRISDEIQGKLDSGHKFNATELSNYKSQIQGITAAAADAGKMGKSLGQTIVGLFQKFGGWRLVTMSMMRVIQGIKDMINNVRELDAAMVELKKVTDLTDSAYEQVYKNATERAKTVGATLTDTINATADFSRLGYNIQDAQRLADVALVYKNVGDGITDIDEASQSVISTMKAFGIEANDAYSVIDKFNSVGNNFAISSKGVGEALQRSASALAAGGNSLDESIALITAGNEVVQDPQKMGTVMKTLSMYLRSSKTELEEAGESTEGMVESVSKLRQELLNLTGGRVDIQLDEDTFKSTYQIMKELAGVWDSLSDITRANILEKIGGKRNANVTAAILQNFATAEKVVETAANSSGSALAENEKYLDSINGKIAQFQAAWQALSATMIDGGFFKSVVGGATDVVNVIDKLASTFGSLPTLIGGITAGISAYRLSQGQRTGLFDVLIDKDGHKSIRLFNTELSRVGSTIKDIYGIYHKQGVDPINAGFNTIGGMFGAKILGGSKEIREYEQLLNNYNKTREVANKYKLGKGLYEDSEEARIAIRNYKEADKALAEYNVRMQTSTSYWAEYYRNTKEGERSFSGFVTKMREAGTLGKAVGAQFKSIGLNLASMFSSAALTMGISAVIQLAITGIGKLITAQEDLRKKTNEATSAHKESLSNITNYKTEIQSLYDSLKSGTLSVEETIQARQRLMQIQGELQSSYGAEAAGLNQITVGSKEAAAALDELAAKEAKRYLDENRTGLNRAQQEMTSDYSYRTSFKTYDINRDGKAVNNAFKRDQLEAIANNLDNAEVFKFLDKNGTVKLNITGDPDEVLDTIAEIRSAASKAGVDLGEVTVSGRKTLDAQLAEWEKIEQDRKVKYGDDYIERTNAMIKQNSEYLGIQNQINDAQNKYNDALVGSYDNDTARAEALSERIKQIHELQDVLDNTKFEGKDGEDVRKVLQDQLDSLIESVSTEELKADLELNIDSENASESFKEIQNALDQFKDENGEIKLSAILDAEGSDAWDALSSAAEHYGLSVEALLPILAQYGMVQSDTNQLAFDAASRFSELSSSANSIAEQQDSLFNALQEQASNGTITLDTYNALIATSKDFANTLEYEAGAMKINSEMAQQLVEAKTKENVAEMQLAKSQALERYKQNEEAIEELTKKEEILSKVHGKLSDEQQANLARWQSENESIMATVNRYNILIDQLQRATGAYAQWQNAKQTENSDSIYKNLVSAKKDIDDALKSGQVGKGNDDYTAAIKLLIPSGEDIKSYRDNVLNRYLKLDDDGNLQWSGLQNFLTDAVKKTDEAGNHLLMTLKDGLYEVAEGATLQDFVDKLNITPEMAKSIFDALEMYDFEFDFSDEEFLDAQNVDLAKRRVEEYEDELTKLQKEYEDIQNNKDLTPEAKTEKLDEISQKIDGINAKEIIAKIQVDAPKLTDAEAALLGIKQKQQEIEDAKVKFGVDSDEVKQAERDLQALQEYINNLDSSTIELTIADLNTKINQSIKAMGEYNVGSAPFEAAKADLQNYLDMLDQLPDEVKTEYGIDANYEQTLRDIIDGKISPKDISVKVKADTTEIEKAKQLIQTLGDTFRVAFSGNAPSDETYSVDADTSAAEGKIKALEKNVVTIKIDADPSEAKAQIASIHADAPVNVIVTADPTLAQMQINSLQAVPVVVSVTANTTAAQVQIAALQAQIAAGSQTVTTTYSPDTASLPTRFSPLTRVVNYVANTKSLPTRLSPITRTVKYVPTGDTGSGHVNGTANAQGTAQAGGNWGAKTGGMTLVGELGREIIVDPTTGQWYTVGDYGAEFVNVKRGSIVFNHQQTEALLKKGYVLGRASALVNGTAMVTGGGRAPTGGGGGGGSTTTTTTTTKTDAGNAKKKGGGGGAAATTTVEVNVDVSIGDKELEEKLKDTLSEMSENFEYILNQYEHKIFLKEQNKADYKEVVAIYEQMLQAIHAKADEYRKLGLSDNSKTVMEMQKKWFDYRDAMRDAIKKHYDDELKHVENMITLTQHQYDDAATNNDYARMQSRVDLIVAYNERIQEISHEAADAMRAIGFDDASDEVMEYSNAWWDAEEAIRKAKQDIVDHLIDIVDQTSDAIDELQSAFDSFKTAAEEYSKSGGFISVDTFQDLMTIGPQYMQLLRDENGLLVINRENVEKLMAARVRSLAAQAMLSYAQRVANAAEEGAVEDLNNLIYATQEASDATMSLAYATLAAAKISQKDYEAALFNMNALYSLYKNTADNMFNDDVEKMSDGMNKLIDYVIDMLEDKINEQVDHLNDLVDQYKEVVDLKKDSLKLTKEENEYQKSLKGKLKEIAQLQERINDLSLDDSREAQAERAKLIEELAELQEETNELQADKAYDVQTDSLDKQYDAYKKAKDNEIKVLEESISSYQKKWDMAISYMEEHWDTLKDELIEWNTRIGNSLNTEIVSEWEQAIKLVEKYGSVLAAVNAAQQQSGSANIPVNDTVSKTTLTSTLNGPDETIAQMMKNSKNWTPADPDNLREQNAMYGASLARYGINAKIGEDGNWYIGNTKYLLYDMYNKFKKDGNMTWLTDPAKAYKQLDKINEMKQNAAKWHTADKDTQDKLRDRNQQLGNELTALGLPVKRGADGVWYLVNTGEKLFDKYHSGGIVGTKANVKQDEVLAILQKGEAVLDEQKQNGLYRLIDFTTVLSEKLGVALKNIDSSIFGSIDTQSLIPQTAGISPPIQNNTTITFGDTIIYGANDDTVKKHQEISRNMMNDLLDTLHIRR